MRKNYVWQLFILICFTITQPMRSQSVLWGMTSAGGEGSGVLFNINTGSTSINSPQFNLKSYTGGLPQYVKLLEYNGKLYGMVGSGNGYIVEYDPSTGYYNAKIAFTGTAGAYPGSSPTGPLMLTSGGKIYGMTRLGGTSNQGVIFEYSPSTNGYTVLVNFTGNTGTAIGSQPFGALVETSTGRFFGMAKFTGTSLYGNIFEFSPTSNTITTVAAFTGTGGAVPGSQPNGSLIEGASNILYGLTSKGGSSSDGGALFSLDVNPSTPTYSLLAAFTGTATGTNPLGSPFKAANGKLYGMASSSGTLSNGTIFEYNIATSTFSKTNDFSGTTDGKTPQGSFIEASGKLYATTSQGGSANIGVLLEYNYSTYSITSVTSFTQNINTGSTPLSTPMLASNGKLYGFTQLGGVNNQGTLYEYVIGTNVINKKIDLNYSQGALPMGSFVMGTNSKMYGFTTQGGSANLGSIFEYDYTNNTLTTKVSMTSANGGLPYGSPLLAGNGKYYGLMSTSTAGFGTIVEYVQAGTTYTKKLDFTGTSGAVMGSQPKGSLIESGGKLYGMTTAGGANGLGVIFEYDYSTNGYNKLVDFSGTTGTVTGSAPEGALLKASNGLFYGVTKTGGSSNLGVLFQYNLSTAGYTALVNFNGTSGSSPIGSLIQGTNGKLYGTTYDGGSGSNGVLYEYDITNSTYSVLVNFAGASNGRNPMGGVYQAANGKLYGMTYAGGSSDKGVIYQYDLSNSTYSLLVNLTGTNGANPGYTRFLEICTVPGALTGAAVSTPTICSGSSSAITLSVGTLATADSYSWTLPAGASVVSGANTNNMSVDFSAVNSAAYTISVSAVNVCGRGIASTLAFTVFANPNITASSGAICSGNSFNLSPAGGAAYTVTGGSSVVSPTITSTYSITGADARGCVAPTVAVATVTVFNLPVLSLSGGTMCTPGSFTLNASGASTYTYNAGQVVSPAVTTTYSAVGTDSNGCVSAAPAVATVTVFNGPAITANSGSICSGSLFDMSPSGGVSYNITGGTATVSPSSTTNYTVIGFSAQGCPSSPVVTTVQVVTRPTIAASGGTICSGQSFVISPTGAFSYGVTGGVFTVSPTSNASYSVTGQTIEGCPSINTVVVTVTVYALPFISVNSGTICLGSSFVMVPSGAASYVYSSGSATVSPVNTATFGVTGTSSLGCPSSNMAVATVTVYNPPTISVSSGTMCEGTSFNLNPTGAPVYNYLNGGPIVSPASTSQYSVTGTSAQGCTSGAVVATVQVILAPVIGATGGTVCAGQTITIPTSGAQTYSITGNSFAVSPSVTTTYSVTGTSSVGCISLSPAVVTVTVFQLPVLSGQSGTVCSGQPYNLNPSGASSYTFTAPTGTVTNPVSPTALTAYSITGTSSVGCVQNVPAVVVVTTQVLPVVTVNSGTICAGGLFTFTPNGASSYVITGGTMVVSPSVTTSYSVTGTSSVGCVSASPAVGTVTVYQLPVIVASGTTTCAGDTYSPIVSGASTYTFSNGSPTMAPLVTTSYSIYGTSAQGCDAAAPTVITINVNPLPILALTGPTAVCAGESVTLDVTGANTYSWSNAAPSTATEVIILVNSTNIYTVTGTDLNGCSSTVAYTLAANPIPTINIPDGSICLGSSYTLTPTGAFTYTYLNGGPVVTPTTNTTYSVIGTSIDGCPSALAGVSTVSVVTILTVAATGNTMICAGQSFSLVASGADSYTWNGTQAGTSYTGTPSSSSTYTIYGVKGACKDTGYVTVKVNPLPVVMVNAKSLNICAGETATLTATGALSYTWSVPAFGSTVAVTPSVVTSYIVLGTDGNDCTNAATVTLNVDACLGVSKSSASAGIQVYPNPTNGVFMIRMPAEGWKYSVCDLIGRELYKGELSEGSNTIDISHSPNGMYTVTMTNSKGDQFTRKMVKEQ